VSRHTLTRGKDESTTTTVIGSYTSGKSTSQQEQLSGYEIGRSSEGNLVET
jgi:hypothetical protein